MVHGAVLSLAGLLHDDVLGVAENLRILFLLVYSAHGVSKSLFKDCFDLVLSATLVLDLGLRMAVCGHRDGGVELFEVVVVPVEWFFVNRMLIWIDARWGSFVVLRLLLDVIESVRLHSTLAGSWLVETLRSTGALLGGAVEEWVWLSVVHLLDWNK